MKFKDSCFLEEFIYLVIINKQTESPLRSDHLD